MRNFYSTTLPDQYAYLDTWWRKRLSIVQSLVRSEAFDTWNVERWKWKSLLMIQLINREIGER